MTRLTLTLLGAPQLRVDETPIAFATRKALAVLIYLAVEGRPVSRESLLALLWPEGDPASTRGALRTTLAYLRRGLGEAVGRLQSEGQHLAFVPDAGDRLDTRALETAAGHTGIAALQAAVATYGDDFLAGRG